LLRIARFSRRTTSTSLRGVLPFPRVKLRIGWGNRAGGDPENRVKGRHRIIPAIEPEDVFVEIGLQMLGFDTAMMRPLDPSFHVAENEVDHRQVRLSLVRVAAERQRVMAISSLGKSGVGCPCVSAHDGAGRNIFFDKTGERVGAPVGHDAEPQSSCIDAALVLLAVVLMGPNFDGADHDGLVMDTATFAARLAADQALVDFYRVFVANGVTLGANHAGAEFMQNLKGSLVTREGKLTLKLNGGLAGDLRSHEICAPEPRRERRVARLHDSASRQRRVGLAATATQHYRGACCETIRFAHRAAFRTRKPAWPTNGLEIASASCVIREDPLKLRKRRREAANVHARENGRFLHPCQATG
jgi:hypothetical protein